LSEIQINYFYGLYPSTAYGNLILVDPILPPKKCALNCITCPVRHDAKTLQRGQSPRPEAIIEDIAEKLPTNVNLNGILLWGSGDPLCLTNAPEIVFSLKLFYSSMQPGHGVFVHTNFLWLLEACNGAYTEAISSIKSLIECVDGFIVPFLWYGAEKYLLGWPREKPIVAYLELLKGLLKHDRNKLLPEVHVFRIYNTLYPGHSHVDELITAFRHVKVETIVLKPIDRPSHNLNVKPVPGSYVKWLSERFVEEGFKVIVDTQTTIQTQPRWKKTAVVLYNHILRMPLKYVEVKSMYGDFGTIALNNLLSKGLATRITWGGDVYYVGTC